MPSPRRSDWATIVLYQSFVFYCDFDPFKNVRSACRIVHIFYVKEDCPYRAYVTPPSQILQKGTVEGSIAISY